MAKQQPSSGETKTPVIVALVFFVLATITLGVLAYMFNSDRATAVEAEKKAQADAKTAQDQAAKSKEAMLIYRAALGITNDQDRADLQGLRFKTDDQKVHADMMKAIEDRARAAITAEAGKFVGRPEGVGINEKQVFAWDWPAGGELTPAPTKSMIDVTVTNYSQRRLAENMYLDGIKSLGQAQETMRQMSAKLDAAQKALDTRTQQIPEEIAKGIKEARDAFEKFKGDFQRLTADQRTELQKKEDAINERAVQNRRVSEKAERLQGQIDRQQQELETRIDPFQFDKPQGKIIRRNNQIVEIDMGSADNLRPGLTFSVMPPETQQRGFESRVREVRDNTTGHMIRRIIPKGSIEVIEVLGPNLAQARITEEESQVRDRVLSGDLLYNAVWRRGSSEHIALFGIFDLDNDGRDDIKALRNELAKMGVVVDAYFDLTTMKWVGDVTSQTMFAVEGYTPTITLADGANQEGKSRIISALADARKSMKEKGVRVLRPRDFFPRIGYKARLDVSEDSINHAAGTYIRTLSTTEGGGGEVPKGEGK